ncbi:MAG: transketolase, partial [Alphaproteobacteria bacterium]|nr:transketolase [Alphaproteobacteria bacterium]
SCPNQLYSALTFKGGAAWREHLKTDLGGTSGIKALLDEHDDDALHALMTNLAGHDLETVLEAYGKAAESDRPQAIIAYTVKGKGLPLEGHKDNHSGLMTPEQMAKFKDMNAIADGEEWGRFAGLDVSPEALQAVIDAAPFAADVKRRFVAPRVAIPDSLAVSVKETASTQEAFGRILNDIGRGDSELASRLITTSPDVTVSTNLGGWVNRRQIFDRHERADTFRDEHVVSAQRWRASPSGQHIELGIAENNLFLTLAALGLSAEMFGTRLLPVGALYDPFIARGQDAMIYACYQDARFMLVGTPSGITLAPEGGAHQSVSTPPMGIAQPNLTYFEPAYVDELSTIMRWGFEHMQDEDGGSVYLRLSTRPIGQPDRTLNEEAILDGAYWQVAPT